MTRRRRTKGPPHVKAIEPERLMEHARANLALVQAERGNTRLRAFLSLFHPGLTQHEVNELCEDVKEAGR